ncbi:type I restriction endonuclease subunit R [bacterium]|nr:type I restriction endonuclease subunit R [bacterium]
MAVVVSPSQNEIEDLREKGVDIQPHRIRMNKEDLDTKFKNPDDSFRLVFVCAMWMTGFDVPCCSTIYLDKIMRNHTLMQTIARANRVFGDKENGLIVDYVGVFKNLEKALAIYGSGVGGEVKPGETPIKHKSELIDRLKEMLDKTEKYCVNNSIDLDKVLIAEGFQRVNLIDEAVNLLLKTDDTKNQFMTLAGNVNKIYRAVLPDPQLKHLAPKCSLIRILTQKIRNILPPADIYDVMDDIEAVLNRSILPKGYEISDKPKKFIVDLSKIDFDGLKKLFVSNKRLKQ